MDEIGSPKEKKKAILFFSILFIFLLSILAILFLIPNKFKLEFSNDSRQSFSSPELEEIVTRAGEIYLLPSEIPEMLTVSDKSQLRDNLFYQNSENGDKVLLFKTADLAIIYRPNIRKVINVDKASNLYQSREDYLKKVKLVVLNGTTRGGLAGSVSERLSSLEFVDVVDRLNTENKPYLESLVVVLNNEFDLQAEEVAKILSAQLISDLPDGEIEREVDIIIILGEDYNES